MISNVSNILPIRPAAPATSAPPVTSIPQHAAPAPDTVEFSSFGRAMARAAAESTMRLAQINAIRSEIQSGTYETPERIRGTAARLLKSLV
ncbi:MAG: flagellar biosynthesis anti-sigma factor FlgM [Planctomycetes bacterium]|nr:flagellar biosynthesis anti-sigma factor FlgM [Planctomycetota bacterium]